MTCSYCGNELDIITQDFSFTKPDGTRHERPPLHLATCQNPACDAYGITVTASKHDSIDLAAYRRGRFSNGGAA